MINVSQKQITQCGHILHLFIVIIVQVTAVLSTL